MTCSDETRHNLSDEDFVTFSEIEGMVELNACEPRPVKVLGIFFHFYIEFLCDKSFVDEM